MNKLSTKVSNEAQPAIANPMLAVRATPINRWHIKNFDLAVGDYVVVPSVRSSHLDFENGIGWIAYDVIVQISRINDLTFCFEFNDELHYELKNDVKKTKSRPNMFGETDKCRYGKNSIDYRLKIEYGI